VENVPTQPKIILTDKDEKKQIASIMKLLKKKGIEFKTDFLPLSLDLEFKSKGCLLNLK